VPDDPAPHGEIDWTTASVEDARLTVEITGDPGEKWLRRLQEVLERLDRSGTAWGEIEVTKATLRVPSVTDGAESDLRHLLESAVLQTNAEFEPDDEADEDEAGGASDEDRGMTDRFRAFSGDDTNDAADDEAAGGDDPEPA
jgi:hypothetical protein